MEEKNSEDTYKMEEKDEKLAGEVKLKSPLLERLDNFWYHYKWHTIAAIFVLILGVILCLQTCGKAEYDAQILYAGPHEIKRTSESGDITPYENTISSLKKVTPDFDGDGVKNIALRNLFIINDEEAEELTGGKEGLEVNASLVQQDYETLSQMLLYGEYYLCFLSERLFLEYDEYYEGALFAPMEKYTLSLTPDEYTLVNERGIYLSSLPFYALPEICELPEDTVVCIRQLSEVSGFFDRDNSERSFSQAEKILENILSYGK